MSVAAASEHALALIGYPAGAGQALRGFGLVALGVPGVPLPDILAACELLGFAGALVHPRFQQAVAEHAQLDLDASRAGQCDALSFAGGARGIYAAPDALLGALQDSSYAARGARAVLIGQGADLRLGLGLGRLGLKSLTLVAETRSQAERLSRDLPAGLAAFALSRQDSALRGLAERADLLVLTAGSLPPGVAQPYHTVLDLTRLARRDTEKAGATWLMLPDLAERVLSRQLEHALGQRFKPDGLSALLPLLTESAEQQR